MTRIEHLNRRLGQTLGYVCGGTLPRFCWKWAPELPYWRTRLGKTYVLCQWKRPEMSEREWALHFQGQFPYPGNGMYHPFSETAVRESALTEELNQNYMRALDQQMSQSFQRHYAAIKDEIERDREADDVRWVEYVQDQNPAFSNFAPGQRGGHVSYGGI